MPPNARLPIALRTAIAKLQAGADPGEVAADIIRKRAESAALRAKLPPKDPRQPHLDALIQAIGARTFDDSELSLDDVLREFQDSKAP